VTAVAHVDGPDSRKQSTKWGGPGRWVHGNREGNEAVRLRHQMSAPMEVG
jgi:hypothetical protein